MISFFIYQLSEGLEIRKILADGIRVQKNQQTRGHIFWILIELGEFKVWLGHPHGEFSNGYANTRNRLYQKQVLAGIPLKNCYENFAKTPRKISTKKIQFFKKYS